MNSGRHRKPPPKRHPTAVATPPSAAASFPLVVVHAASRFAIAIALDGGGPAFFVPSSLFLHQVLSFFCKYDQERALTRGRESCSPSARARTHTSRHTNTTPMTPLETRMLQPHPSRRFSPDKSSTGGCPPSHPPAGGGSAGGGDGESSVPGGLHLLSQAFRFVRRRFPVSEEEGGGHAHARVRDDVMMR